MVGRMLGQVTAGSVRKSQNDITYGKTRQMVRQWERKDGNSSDGNRVQMETSQVETEPAAG